MSVWDDPRVAAGMRAQLDARRERIADGERPVGWKVGFGSAQAMANLGTDGPLVGFLTDRGAVADGATYSIADWTKGALEPEIAVHMAADLEPNAGPAAAAEAIAGLGLAFELADLDAPLDDLEGVVAGNIFQRGFVLGPVHRDRAGGDATGLRADVERDGAPLAATDTPLEMVGDLREIVAHVADLLGAFGERLSAGDVIITGSVVPLIWLDGDASFRYRLDPLGELALNIRA